MSTNLDAYLQTKKVVEQYEAAGDTKRCEQYRASAIAYWNKLTPKEQRVVAEKFLPQPPLVIHPDPKRYADPAQVSRG